MSEWINCIERQPIIDYSEPEYKRSVRAIVACDAGVMEMTYISNAYARTEKGRLARWEWQGRIAPWEPTHWMLLPSPPEAV